MNVRNSARRRSGGAIPGNRASSQSATAAAPRRNRIPNSWKLTRPLRSLSWQPHRLFPARPEMQTWADDSALVGRRIRSAGRFRLLTSSRATLPAVTLAAALVAVAGTIGPDARWLAALGRSIGRLGGVPHGIPYAAAPSTGWHNVPVLAELIFRGLETSLGDRGLLAAQLAAAVVAMLFVVRDARRLGATDSGTAAAVLVVLISGLLAFAGVRAQLFSLALFPALLWLLRSEEDEPSRRIWLLVPLVALWSNLHGTVLVGVGLALLYL